MTFFGEVYCRGIVYGELCDERLCCWDFVPKRNCGIESSFDELSRNRRWRDIVFMCGEAKDWSRTRKAWSWPVRRKPTGKLSGPRGRSLPKLSWPNSQLMATVRNYIGRRYVVSNHPVRLCYPEGVRVAERPQTVRRLTSDLEYPLAVDHEEYTTIC